MAFWHKVRGRTWVSEQILGFFQSWWFAGVGDLAVGLFRKHGELQAQTPGAAADPLLDFLAEGRVVTPTSIRRAPLMPYGKASAQVRYRE